MALSVRLKCFGRKGSSKYRLVVTDSRRKRDGLVLEELGHYDPHKDGSEKISLKKDRLQYWIDCGGKPTETVRSLLKKAAFFVEK